MIPSLPATSPPPAADPVRRAELRSRAAELEAVFLAEMLGHAGVGRPPEGFGGGIGEEQFGSWLRRAQAEAMVASGGIGMAESIFRSLVARDVG